MKIIKEGKKTFRLTCSKCGCEFEYELDEIGTTIPGKVECPCCGEYLYHPNQDAKIENIIYHPGTIINNPVLDNTVTTPYIDPNIKYELKDALTGKPTWCDCAYPCSECGKANYCAYRYLAKEEK